MEVSQEVRSGYRMTKLGWIPYSWRIVSFGEITKINQGLQIAISERYTTPIPNSHFYITNEFLKIGSKNEYFILDPKPNVLCNKEDILMTRTGNTGHVVTNVEGAFHNNFFKIKFDKTKLDKRFFYFFLTSYPTQHKILVYAGVSTIPDLNHSDFYRLVIPLPSLLEQKKIADILSTWDHAIQTTQALVEKLQLRKRGLMQQLLSGKKRLPGFSGEWEDVKLKECAQNENIKNKSRFTGKKLFGVNKKLGLIPMKEQVKGKSFERCKIVKPNWFAYNPMRINIGSIAYHEFEEDLMVSGDYVVFSCDRKKLLPEYLNLFRRGHIWNQFMIRAGNGSVRIRIYFKDLGFLKLPLPSIKEQRTIAQVLSKADEEIEKTQDYLVQLQEQKKGLMQLLLTGQKRVKV